MARLTIYLNDAAKRRVRAAARKSRVSVSRWVADLVESRTRTKWLAEVRQLAGAWPDFPDLHETRPVRRRDRSRARL
ncbi:MAG TPA: CopG family transcriptional regulator [Terriglobia bacterium]|nr:CopG family transcriptional regulator [Terriglobia bacterium]